MQALEMKSWNLEIVYVRFKCSCSVKSGFEPARALFAFLNPLLFGYCVVSKFLRIIFDRNLSLLRMGAI